MTYLGLLRSVVKEAYLVMIRFCTPIGNMEVSRSAAGLNRVRVVEEVSLIDSDDPLLLEAKKQLELFFERKLTQFDLPLDLSTGTQFQQKVWQYLSTIPYGNTCTYGQIADFLDNPGAVRAVGAANGKNPLPIILPCHRVLASNGKLGGYYYGLKIKRFLLDLEGAPNNVGLFSRR